MLGRRQNKFMRIFPEAIDLIVRGLKSGLPVSESIRVVGQEIADPIGVEFRGISDAIKFGKPMIEACGRSSLRIDMPEFRFFIIGLVDPAGDRRQSGGDAGEPVDRAAPPQAR